MKWWPRRTRVVKGHDGRKILIQLPGRASVHHVARALTLAVSVSGQYTSDDASLRVS